MWFESQNCAMMGLQATTGKRKLEAAASTAEPCPAKAGRWEPEDCIARLQAVAVPEDSWRAPSLAATLLSTDDFDDEEDFEDELSDDDRCAEPTRFPQSSYHPTTRYSSAEEYQRPYWQYYQPPSAQQTIRCEENGKSYLELGAAPPARTRCCDGRTRWCNVPCYRQRRLAVLNLSMCKLARYRQCSDPSLRRSVLICNTLRRIEREMEAEPPEPSYTSLPELPPPSRPAPVMEPSYEQSLRDVTASGRATPFPSAAPDSDSGIGDEDTKPINWGSVLSLTSQTDLEPLNNNELYAELGLSGDEWSKETSPSAMRSGAENEWDGFMSVLVGGS